MSTDAPVSVENCQYCGNNPVPHFLNWYFESLNVLLTPFRTFLLSNPVTLFLERLVSGLWPFLIRISIPIGIVKIQADVKKCKVPRAVVLWEEAIKRGMKMEEILLFGNSIDAYRVQDGSRTLLFSGLPRPVGGDPEAVDIMDDKAILKNILGRAGLPVPFGGSCWRYGQAKKWFEEIRRRDPQAKVIVKPRLGSRGRHSTTWIATEKELKKAFRVAKQLCFWVMVEEMIPGPVYRATLLDFKLAGVLRGDAPSVMGDGVKNINQLIEQKNASREEGVGEVKKSDKMLQFLARQDLNFDSVPKKNEQIFLTEKIGVRYGGSSSEDYDICHPDNKVLFEAAARALGDPVVGFDYIIPDITQSYREQKTGFIEANSLPFIQLHHDPLKGTPRNAAGMVWDMMKMPAAKF